MVIPNFCLDGKVAIVTGGKGGIGKAIALAFAEAGADVVVCGRVIEDGKLEAVAEEVRKLGPRSLAVQTDISKKADVDNLVQRVMDEFGVIDILVNNAGINIRIPLLELDEDDWDRLMDIDLKGYYLCSQAVGRNMVERKRGNIINMASTHSFKADARLGVYCIAKAGVVMLTRVLARELGPHNIRVNAIAPTLVKTELSRPDWADPERAKYVKSLMPLGGRLLESSDIVGAALFLSSDASSCITGHTIPADAGILA